MVEAMSSSPRSVALVYPEPHELADAIDHHSAYLAAAIATEGLEVRRCRQIPDPGVLEDTVVLQYNPFAYGRRGFAPGLLLRLLRLRLARSRPLIVTMLHEVYVPLRGARFIVMGIW